MKERVKILSAPGRQNTLGLLKVTGTLSYIYLTFILPNCTPIFISMENFWATISSPNFADSNMRLHNQISPQRRYKNYVTL